MKIRFIAVALSCFVLSLPAMSMDGEVQNPSATSLEKNLIKINLNTAGVEDLAGSFKGIGRKRAQAIVDYREEHGAFKSVSDISLVKGLGLHFVNTHLEELQRVFSVS